MDGFEGELIDSLGRPQAEHLAQDADFAAEVGCVIGHHQHRAQRRCADSHACGAAVYKSSPASRTNPSTWSRSSESVQRVGLTVPHPIERAMHCSGGEEGQDSDDDNHRARQAWMAGVTRRCRAEKT